MPTRGKRLPNDVTADLLAVAIRWICRKFRFYHKATRNFPLAELAIGNFKTHQQSNFFGLLNNHMLKMFFNKIAKLIIDYNSGNITITQKMNLISSILPQSRSILLHFLKPNWYFLIVK